MFRVGSFLDSYNRGLRKIFEVIFEVYFRPFQRLFDEKNCTTLQKSPSVNGCINH